MKPDMPVCDSEVCRRASRLYKTERIINMEILLRPLGNDPHGNDLGAILITKQCMGCGEEVIGEPKTVSCTLAPVQAAIKTLLVVWYHCSGCTALPVCLRRCIGCGTRCGEDQRHHMKNLGRATGWIYECGDSPECRKTAFHVMKALLQIIMPGETVVVGCMACGKMTDGTKRCSRCKATHYCNRECQAMDWVKHKHECL